MSPVSQSPDVARDPFGRRAVGRRRLLMALGAGLGLATITVAVYLVSGGSGGDASSAGGHDHAAAPVADSAMPVSLSDTDRQRIGVTFTTVERTPLNRLVRTVAQVTYDETETKLRRAGGGY